MGHRHGNAGASALRRYEDGLRRWRALIRAKVALVTAPMIAAGVAAAVFGGAAWDFAGGLLAGAGLAMAAWVWESPPRYVEQWRDGSQGERRTAARLRRLEHDGWVLLHDVPGPFGNRDHIAIGPAGLFL